MPRYKRRILDLVIVFCIAKGRHSYFSPRTKAIMRACGVSQTLLPTSKMRFITMLLPEIARRSIPHNRAPKPLPIMF